MNLEKLSNEELIQIAKNGNEDAKEYFFEKNDRFNYHIAQRYQNVAPLDDLLGLCRLGMLKAYNSFDTSKGIKFATYSSRIMINEILMFNRKNKKHAHITSLENIIHTDMDGSELSLMDLIPIEEPEFSFEDYDELYFILEEFNKTAKERDKQILNLVLIQKKKQREVADELGVSQSYISRLETKVLKNLRKIAKEDTKMTKAKINKEDLYKTFELFPERSLKDIARGFGVSAPTINYHHKNWLKSKEVIEEPTIKIEKKEIIKKVEESIKKEEPKVTQKENKNLKNDNISEIKLNISGDKDKISEILFTYVDLIKAMPEDSKVELGFNATIK